MRRAVGGPAQPADAPLDFVHAQRVARDVNLLADLHPVLAGCGFKTQALDSLDLAAQTFELALGLLDVLAGDVALDVLQLFQQAGFFALEQLLAQVPALLALLDVGAVVAAVGFQPGNAHLPDVVHHPVQEVAVVRNDQR